MKFKNAFSPLTHTHTHTHTSFFYVKRKGEKKQILNSYQDLNKWDFIELRVLGEGKKNKKIKKNYLQKY